MTSVKRDYKKIYANLTDEQKKKRIEWKNKKYHADKDFRKKAIEYSKKRRKNLNSDEKEKLKDYIRDYSKTYKQKVHNKFEETNDPFIFIQYKRRKIKKSANDRNIQFELTKNDLLNLYNKQKGRCYYTGEKLILKILSGKIANRENMDEFKNYLTVDRLNPKKGYIKDNVVLCTWKVNTAKGSLTYGEFVKICENIKLKDKK